MSSPRPIQPISFQVDSICGTVPLNYLAVLKRLPVPVCKDNVIVKKEVLECWECFRWQDWYRRSVSCSVAPPVLAVALHISSLVESPWSSRARYGSSHHPLVNMNRNKTKNWRMGSDKKQEGSKGVYNGRRTINPPPGRTFGPSLDMITFLLLTNLFCL